jgi:hypothetical protein
VPAQHWATPSPTHTPTPYFRTEARGTSPSQAAQAAGAVNRPRTQAARQPHSARACLLSAGRSCHTRTMQCELPTVIGGHSRSGYPAPPAQRSSLLMPSPRYRPSKLVISACDPRAIKSGVQQSRAVYSGYSQHQRGRRLLAFVLFSAVVMWWWSEGRAGADRDNVSLSAELKWPPRHSCKHYHRPAKG